MVEALLLLACTSPDSDNPKPSETDTGTRTTTDSTDADPCPESGDSESSTRAPEELLLEVGAAAKVLGDTPWNDGTGYMDSLRAAAAGDVDGDGHQDLVAGCVNCDVNNSFGKAWLVLGPFGGTSSVTSGRAELHTTENSGLGYSIASAGDTTGNGTDDLLFAEISYVGGPDTSGRVLLVTEPPSGSAEAVDVASASFVGEYVYNSYSAYSGTGEEVGGGEFDGDDQRDIFISAPWYGTSGAVYAMSGPFTGEYLVPADATFVFDMDSANPRATANLGDHDGDGIDDLGIGIGYSDRTDVYVFNGPLGGSVGVADADAVLVAQEGETPAVGRGLLASAGDINADGHPDAIVGSPYLPGDAGDEVRGAYVVTGPFAPTADLVDSHAILLNSGDYGSIQVSGPGDLDGDGWDDVVVGRPEWDYWDPQPGRVFVTMGPVCGTIDLVTEATYTLIGSDFANAGEVIDHADFDADGHPDLLITGPEDTEGGGYAGAAWIVGGFDER